MTGLEGTGTLIRLTLRLGRARLAAWTLGVLGIAYASANAFRQLYPTVESRQILASTLAKNPGLIALTGPGFDLSSIGGLVAWRLGGFGAVSVALLGMFTVVHHTRAEEEAGRLELIGSTRVGRFAPIASTMSVALGSTLVIGLALGTCLVLLGLPAAGSFALGLGFTAAGWSLASIAAITAQLTQSARGANGLAGSILGLAFFLRAVGDSAGSGAMSVLSWLSPIGWSQQVRPFAGERWWVFALPVGLTAVATTVALALNARRDLGDGVLASRPGPDSGGDSLSTSTGLAWRMHRGALLGWVLGLSALGAGLGSLAEGMGSLIEDNDQLAEIFVRMGGEQNLIRAYFSSVMGVVGLMVGAYSVQEVLRLRSEEVSGRVEPVLATKVSRPAWVLSHLSVVFGGAVVLLASAGAVTGVVHGLRSGDLLPSVIDLSKTALVQLPAVMVMIGLTLGLFGLVPRASSAAWGLLSAFVALTQLGPMLQLEPWLQGLSPFSHTPRFPVERLSWATLGMLLLIASGTLTGGLVGFSRRDVG